VPWVILGAMLYGTYKAHQAEAQYDEMSQMYGEAQWTREDAAHFRELSELGAFGLGLRAGVTAGLLAGAVPGLWEGFSRLPDMEPAERYEFLGSLGVGTIAGLRGYQSTYSASLGMVRRGLLGGARGSSVMARAVGRYPASRTAQPTVADVIESGGSYIIGATPHRVITQAYAGAGISLEGVPISSAALTSSSIIAMRGIGSVAPRRPVTRFVTNAEGKTVDLGPTLDRIARGERFPHRNDGTIFRNREGLLPAKREGYYREYVHPTPNVPGPGPQRIVIGEGGDR